MQRTLTPRQLTPAGAGGGEQRTQLATPVSQAESDGGDMQKQLERQAGHAKAWRDKAHRLGDLIIKQEAQNKALQHQLAALQHAQAQALAAATDEHGADSVLGAADLASMRQQLVLARAQLEQQAEELEGARADYGTRQALLKEAAGVARREVLSLQGVNRELQAVADRLQQQNDALAAQLRATQTASSELGSTGGDGWGSAGPSPAKRHNDTALLQAMLRKQDGELSVLREDSASQQEELMRSLALLQAAHKREEDMRRQVCSLEGQLDITRDELAQKDAHLELLRERQEEQEDSLCQLNAALAAAEEQAAATAATSTASEEEKVAQQAAEAAALRQRCQQAKELAAARVQVTALEQQQSVLREQLQHRDAEVAQLRLQVPELRSQAATLQRQLQEQQQAVAEELERSQQAAAEASTAVQLKASEHQAALQQELEAAAGTLADLREQLQATEEERAAAQARGDYLAGALERQQQEQEEQAVAAADEAATQQQQQAEERAMLQQQLAEAEQRLASLQQRLASEEGQQAELAGQSDARAAALEQQLQAAVAEREAAARQLHRLQHEVSDAELLLASFSSGGSLFSTPQASPKRLAGSDSSDESYPAATANAATAVQWLQQQQASAPASPVRAESASSPGGMAAGSSRLCRRIQAVLHDVQRLQQQLQQQQRQRDGSSTDLSPEDSAADSAAPPAQPEPAATTTPRSKLPLLSPVQSDTNSGSLIAAVHGSASPCTATPTAPSPLSGEADISPLRSYPVQTTPGTTPPTSSPAKAALRQLQQPQEQQKSQALKTGPAADGSGGGNKGGGRRGALDAFMRTAGLAGVVGAVAIQLLQHIRPH